jgi:uncharacterized membrane protein
VLGHPLHPALVHFPIALLLSATVADMAWVAGITSDTHLAAILMAGGLATGLVAMGAGMVDFTRIDDTVVPHALRHMAVVGLAWLGYAISLYLRRDSFSASVTAGVPSIMLSVVSACVLALGGWLGGKLVYSFAAGVAKPTKSAG